jgi:hypothetical protein
MCGCRQISAVERDYLPIRQRTREAKGIGRHHAHADSVEIALGRTGGEPLRRGVGEIDDDQRMVAELGGKLYDSRIYA